MAKFLSLIKGFVSNLGKKDSNASQEKKDADVMIASNLSDDAYRMIEELEGELGPRPAATKESRRAARRIASIFEKYSDDVTITSARLYPSINKGFLIILVLLILLMFIFSLFRLPYISLVLLGVYLWGIAKEVRNPSLDF